MSTIPLLPMAKTIRVTLFEREVRERLSGAAIEILLAGAQVLSEGETGPAGPGRSGTMFFGSTMLTLDLAQAAERVRELCDGATARRIATMMSSDSRVTQQLRVLVEREARRLLGRTPADLATEVRFRTQGATLYIDIDFEARAA